MPSALITGVTGQDGLYLAELLLQKGYDVHGLVRGGPDRLEELRTRLPGVRLHLGDLTEPATLVRALEASAPDEVYNLAARTSVAASWADARGTCEVTALGVLHLLDATRQVLAGQDVRFVQASSSDIFGLARECPQNELTPLWPRSPYGVSKAFGHHMTVNYRESYGLHASSAILYNHESPRRSPEFVTRKIAAGVARIHRGLDTHLVLGDLTAERDWGFAAEYVEALWLMLQQPEAGDYVIATGETHTVEEFVDAAFRHVGIRDWHRHVRTDPALHRPADVRRLVGDPAKAREVLGWKARTSFEELVALMVEAELSA